MSTPPTITPQVFVRIDHNGVYKAMLVNPNPEGTDPADPNRIVGLRVYSSPDESTPYGAALGTITVPTAEPDALLELDFKPGVLGVLAFSFVNAVGPGLEGPLSDVAPYVYASALAVEITLSAQALCKTKPTSLDILKSIQDASRLVDMYTGNRFFPLWLSKPCDGSGAADMVIDDPIITVTEIRSDGFLTISSGDRTLVDPCNYRVYNRHIRYRKAYDSARPTQPDGYLEFPGDGSGGMTNPDDRDAPRISFRNPNDVRKGKRVQRRHGHAYASGAYRHRHLLGHNDAGFVRGRQNILVKGFFGYTEPDLSVPVGIRLATERMVLRTVLVQRGTRAEVERILRGHNITMEKTDTHFVMFRTNDPLQGAFTGEPLIDQWLARYSRAMQIGAV